MRITAVTVAPEMPVGVREKVNIGWMFVERHVALTWKFVKFRVKLLSVCVCVERESARDRQKEEGSPPRLASEYRSKVEGVPLAPRYTCQSAYDTVLQARLWKPDVIHEES
jgi:hypothetical protein